MAINNKDLLDMSPAFFSEFTDVAVTKKGLRSWAKLAAEKGKKKPSGEKEVIHALKRAR